MNHEDRVILLSECEQLWASCAAQALDARLTNRVVAPSVNPALDTVNKSYSYLFLCFTFPTWM